MTAIEAKAMAEDARRKAERLWHEFKRVEADMQPYISQMETARQAWYNALQDSRLLDRMAEEIERSAKEI